MTSVRPIIWMAALLAAMVIRAQSAHAQGAPLSRAIEEDPRQLSAGLFAGVWIPTGAQRTYLERAVLAGIQGTWTIRPEFAITGTVAWSPNHDLRSPSAAAIDIFQFDGGVELRAADFYESGAMALTPFAGLGGGARSYVFRHQNTRTRTFRAGYGAGGVDMHFDHLAVRIEGRDYLSRFYQLTGTGKNTWRNDVVAMASLRVRF